MKEETQQSQKNTGSHGGGVFSSGRKRALEPTRRPNTLCAAEKTEGGLENVITEAKKQGVHLIRLTDDKGNDLLTGSVHPFETLC